MSGDPGEEDDHEDAVLDVRFTKQIPCRIFLMSGYVKNIVFSAVFVIDYSTYVNCKCIRNLTFSSYYVWYATVCAMILNTYQHTNYRLGFKEFLSMVNVGKSTSGDIR